MSSFAEAWGKKWRRDEPWQSKTHQALFLICAAFLSVYLSYVLFLAQSPVFTRTFETIYSFAWFALYAVMIFALLLWSCQALLRFEKRRPDVEFPKQGFSLLFFAISAGLSLLLLTIPFLASYPGGMTYDIYNQWTQVHTGQFNNWHPVAHTLLMWLGTRVVDSYPWLVILQLICFSAVMAYLMETLRMWGVSRPLLLVLQGLIATSPLVSSVLTCAGKDGAMCLGAVLLCAQAVNLYFSGGEWARRGRNAAAFGVALAFTTLMRHNAMLFTVPLLVCVLLSYPAVRKRLWISAGVMVACTVLVMGPLYGALDMVRPNNTLEESVGIPMTILCDARALSPEALDAEAAAFLETLMPQETFEEKYVLHKYNSVKFEWPREYIENMPLDKLLRMAANTAQRNPRGAFETFNALTDLVWDVTGKNEAIDSANRSDELEEYRYMNTHLNQIGASLKKLIDIPRGLPFLSWIFQNIGVQLAALLLCGLWALYRDGLRALTLCVPVLIYHLGTMLLLCDNDARFFQFSMVICLPMVLALWRRPSAPPALVMNTDE